MGRTQAGALNEFASPLTKSITGSSKTFWLAKRTDNRYELGDHIVFMVWAESEADAHGTLVDEMPSGDYVAEQLSAEGPTDLFLSASHCAR